MDVESSNLQNEFFNTARRERIVVTIFLANGKKRVGRIRAFDKFTLLLDGPFGEQIVYKHAISTVGAGRHPSHVEDPSPHHEATVAGNDESAATPS